MRAGLPLITPACIAGAPPASLRFAGVGLNAARRAAAMRSGVVNRSHRRAVPWSPMVLPSV